MDLMKNGNRLRAERGSKTLKEVADEVNITQSALAMYERGQRSPRDEIKERIAQYYKKPVGYLFFGGEINETLNDGPAA